MHASKSATPYLELNRVLDALVTSLRRILGQNFVGFYLQGSFAVGDFDQHSDVDFIVVIEEALAAEQVDELQVMHNEIFQMESEWAKHLEGSYFPKDILRDPALSGQPLWYLDNGARSLVFSDHCNTILVRHIVREMGVTLVGPPPMTLVNPISVEILKAEIFETLNEWGEVILDNPDPFRNWFYQSFIVLSYCRMLHDLVKGRPGSKREGAEWAKRELDPSWMDLIDGAWAGRPDPAQKIKAAPDPDEFVRTLDFVRYVMDKSEGYVVTEGEG